MVEHEKEDFLLGGILISIKRDHALKWFRCGVLIAYIVNVKAKQSAGDSKIFW